ncbi:hypothetical protein GYD59_004703 [Salmonella enterica]|nr:hypothetical protein [Salmonella enterica]EJX0634579.1 hypothetical protein [Salmonella enterica]
MNVKAIETKYGLIYGRNALILSGTELRLYPFNFVVKASLSLSACKPIIANAQDVNIEISFSNIEQLSIYKVDNYPFEKYTQSSFDLVEDIKKDGVQHIILSTYDHVFDIIGRYEISYH